MLVLVGCRGDTDPDRPVEISPLRLGEEGPGTCLRIDDDLGPQIPTLPRVECDVEHTHEIYAVERHPADVYPGFNELEAYAQRVCLTAFEPYVGSNPFDSSYFHSWLVPTLDGWNDEEDREILCVLGDQEGMRLTSSAFQSGR